MFLFFLLLFSPFSTQADIFQWQDSKGNTHFSDQPHQGAKTLHIDPGYSFIQVKKVYDGDTILLVNGNKIRLLGINTPEVEGRYKSASEAGGEAAKQWLKKSLLNQKVRVEIDVEKHDKYSRILAHVFTANKQHINLELVKNGLASVNIHPPNLKYTDELLAAQKHAEQTQLGIWSHQEYAPKHFSEINRSNYKGWHRIKGKIQAITQTRKYISLTLSESFSLKIRKTSLELFSDLDDYINAQIEVRGWINKQKKRYTIYIRHPSQILILPSLVLLCHITPEPLEKV